MIRNFFFNFEQYVFNYCVYSTQCTLKKSWLKNFFGLDKYYAFIKNRISLWVYYKNNPSQYFNEKRKIQTDLNLILNRQFANKAFYLRARKGQKCSPFLTPKPKVIKTPNLACWLVFTNFFWKSGLGWWSHDCHESLIIFSKIDVSFAMTSQTILNLYISLFFDKES